MILHKQVIGLAAEARTLAAPAMIHPSDGSTGQEDFQAHTMLTARQLARILDSLESLSPTSWRRCVTHPTWRRHPLPPPLNRAVAVLGEVVPEILEDRALAGDIERARELITSGRLVPQAPRPEPLLAPAPVYGP